MLAIFRLIVLSVLLMLLSYSPWAQAITYTNEDDSCLTISAIHIIPHNCDKLLTKDYVILRELDIKVGDCIAPKELQDALQLIEKRIFNTQLFNYVSAVAHTEFYDADIENENEKYVSKNIVVQIYLNERFPIWPEPQFELADRNINVWMKEQNFKHNRINLGLTLLHKNFNGKRQLIGLTGQIGYTQKVGISFANPFADKNQQHGYGIGIYSMRNREIPYMTDSNKLKFYRNFDAFMQHQGRLETWYTYRPAFATQHKIGTNFTYYQIHDTIVLLNPEYLGNGISNDVLANLFYRFEYNGVDNWNYPLRGHRFIGRFDQYYAFRSKAWQTSLHLHQDVYFQVGKKWFSSLVLRARISGKQEQPYILRRNLGYDYDYIRGYQYYVIDGSSFALARASWKYEALNWSIYLPSIKYFQVIPIRIYPKIFADIGTAYNPMPINDNLHSKTLYGYGFGIDIVTFYDIKFRIEYTFNHLGEHGVFLHRSGE